jgi:hypothetical protein
VICIFRQKCLMALVEASRKDAPASGDAGKYGRLVLRWRSLAIWANDRAYTCRRALTSDKKRLVNCQSQDEGGPKKMKALARVQCFDSVWSPCRRPTSRDDTRSDITGNFPCGGWGVQRGYGQTNLSYLALGTKRMPMELSPPACDTVQYNSIAANKQVM